MLDLVARLAHRAEVVEDPEGAPLGRNHQVVALDLQVGDRRDRQVELERLPVGAVVERDVEAELGAGVEQPLARRVLAHDAHEVVGRNAVLAVGQQIPVGAVVVGAEDVRPEVVEPVVVHRDEGAPRVLRRRLDHVDRRPLGHRLGRHVLPGGAVVARDVHQAVVAAGPEQAGRLRRDLEGEDRVVDLDAGVVPGDRAAGVALLALVVARQVGADDRPALPLVGRAMDDVGSGVEHVRVVRRDANRRVPLEAVLQVLGGLADAPSAARA